MSISKKRSVTLKHYSTVVDIADEMHKKERGWEGEKENCQNVAVT